MLSNSNKYKDNSNLESEGRLCKVCRNPLPNFRCKYTCGDPICIKIYAKKIRDAKKELKDLAKLSQPTKICERPECINEFIPIRADHIYCSNRCREIDAWRRAKVIHGPNYKKNKKPKTKDKQSKRRCQAVIYEGTVFERICGEPLYGSNRFLCEKCFKNKNSKEQNMGYEK